MLDDENIKRLGSPPRSAPLSLWPTALFGGLYRQSAWLMAFLGAHLFWQFQPHQAFEGSPGWSTLQWLLRPSLFAIALAFAFVGVGRGIVAMAALRLGEGVVAELREARRVCAAGPFGLYRLRYTFTLVDGVARIATRWWLGASARAPAAREVLLARVEPPHTAVALADLPAVVSGIGGDGVRVRAPWLGLLSLLLPALVIFQNRVFLLRSDSNEIKTLIAVMLLVFGLLPAAIVIVAAAARRDHA